MNEIVCATRGGEGSRAVQIAAIAEAKETNNPIAFLYVASMRNYAHEAHGLQEAIRDELIWLGKALLFVAQTRAQEAGVLSRTDIREGDIENEICNYLTEIDARLLFLGAPRGMTAELIGDDSVERFATRLYERTNVEVRIVRPEEA